MTAYIALVHKDPGSDFGVSFPDFPGCVTATTTLGEVTAMAEEALALHVAGMIDDGMAIPAPSSFDAIREQQMRSGDPGVPVLVALRLPETARTA